MYYFLFITANNRQIYIFFKLIKFTQQLTTKTIVRIKIKSLILFYYILYLKYVETLILLFFDD